MRFLAYQCITFFPLKETAKKQHKVVLLKTKSFIQSDPDWQKAKQIILCGPQFFVAFLAKVSVLVAAPSGSRLGLLDDQQSSGH